jgi:alkylated DNA nucleotide flippase Atl1
MSLVDQRRLQAVVGSIPPRRWAAYGDVARVCGGTHTHARTLNQRFIRDPIPGAHRVLMATGAVSANALGGPERVRAQLEGEGLHFIDGKADPAARVSLRELTASRYATVSEPDE